MKIFNRFLFIGLAFVCLGSLTFLLLRTSSPQPQQKTETLQRIETHSHPGDTSERRTLFPVTDAPKTEKKDGSQEPLSPQAQAKGIVKALTPALELWETDPERASAKLHDIVKELGGGDPKWTEFYHLLGHSIVYKPPGAPDGLVLTLEDAKRYYLLKNELIGLSENDKKYAKELQLSLRWNKEGKQVGQQTQPIRDLLGWMKENAPDEWGTVNTHFWETLPSRNAPPALSEENWRTVEERVAIQYDTFLEALDLLPENSITLKTLYGSSQDVAQHMLSSEQTTLEASPLVDTSELPAHTWDMVHEKTVEVDDLSPESSPETLASDADIPIDFQTAIPTEESLQTAFEGQFSPERFQKAMSTLTQYGFKDGLRRVRNDDPELASYIEQNLQRQSPPQQK